MQSLVKGKGYRKLLMPAALFAACLLLLQVVRPAYDDWYFMIQTEQGSLLDFLLDYYQNANGRIVSNTLVYVLLKDFFWLWRGLNAVALACAAYAIPRLVKGRDGVEPTDLLAGAALVFLLHDEAAREAYFWATGSINYLWPIAASLLLLIPFADLALRGEKPAKATPLLLLLAPLAGGGSEQIGLCCLAMMACALVAVLFQKKKMPPLLGVLFLCVLAFFLAVVLAPAIENRTASEVAARFPDFYDQTFAQRVSLGFRFVYERLFSGLYVYVLLSFALALYTFHQGQGWEGRLPSRRGRWISRISLALLMAALAPMLVRGEAMTLWFTFQELTGSLLSRLTLLAPFVFWSAFLLLWLFLLWSTDRLGFLLTGGAICSLIVMCFSPTIYASGWRTATMGAVMLMLSVFRFLDRHNLTGKAAWPLAIAAAVNLVGILTISYPWYH